MRNRSSFTFHNNLQIFTKDFSKVAKLNRFDFIGKFRFFIFFGFFSWFCFFILFNFLRLDKCKNIRICSNFWIFDIRVSRIKRIKFKLPLEDVLLAVLFLWILFLFLFWFLWIDECVVFFLCECPKQTSELTILQQWNFDSNILSFFLETRCSFWDVVCVDSLWLN